MAMNPWIVDAEVTKLDVGEWTDPSGKVWVVWVNVRKELSVGEARAMMRSISTVSQPIVGRGQVARNPEATLEWTEYSFARMVAYVVDWSFAHEAEVKMAPSRANYGKLKQDLFDMIDNAVDAHEKSLAEEKKVPSTKPEPEATSV